MRIAISAPVQRPNKVAQSPSNSSIIPVGHCCKLTAQSKCCEAHWGTGTNFLFLRVLSLSSLIICFSSTLLFPLIEDHHLTSRSRIRESDLGNHQRGIDRQSPRS